MFQVSLGEFVHAACMQITGLSQRTSLQRLSPLPATQSRTQVADGPRESVDLSEISGSPSGGQLAKQTSWSNRLISALGLGVMALSVAGCIPQGPATNEGGQAEQQQVVTATDYAQRMDQLRAEKDKTAFYQMAEAGYHKAMLDRFQGAPPAILEIAQKAVQAFDFKGDPAAQQRQMQEAMRTIAELSNQDSQAARFQDAARTSLEIGKVFQQGAGGGAFDLVSGLKLAAYQKALPQALVHIRQAPDLVAQQSGYDLALVRNYVESMVMAPEVTLAFAPQLKDDALAARLFEKTGDELYKRVQTEKDWLGSGVTSALDVIQNIRKSVGF